MKATTLTPTDLFGLPCQYVVPLFQRPYVWNLDEQWRPLWDDVRNVADRLLEAGSWSGSGVTPHFLGAIVLDQQLVPPGAIPQRHVVDGQQRLTTLQLLLDATDAVVRLHGADPDKYEIGRLVLNRDVNPARPDDRFKVWPTDRDQAAFRVAMDDDSAPHGDLAKSRIATAHRFFESEITEWAEPGGDPERCRARLHALVQTLTQYLKLVVIDLESGDNAQVIFEALNHRGAPLLAGDLVKNYVFQAAQLAGLDVVPLYDTYWKPFDTEPWRRKVRQGRLFRPRIDVFLNYWLALRLVREVPADRIYDDFRAHANEQGGSPQRLIEDLAGARGVYDAIDAQPPHSVEGTFAYRVLDVMEASVWGSVLLLLLDPASAIPDDERQLALRAIESWAVRRMACRLTAKGANQLAMDLLRQLLDGNQAVAGQITVDFLAGHDADSRLWPSDGAVRDAFLEQPLYTSITRARLRMLLEALEDAVRSPMTDAGHCERHTLTIEHVLPQGWREHWAPPAGLFGVAAPKRDRLLHTIGNLTLVSKRLNPALSNRPWTDAEADLIHVGWKGKRTLLREHSDLKLTRLIEDGWPDAWDETSVAERGNALADVAIRVWPSARGIVAP